MTHKLTISLYAVALAIAVIAASFYVLSSEMTFGSVIQGNEYNYELVTSADASTTAITELKEGYGSLGSVTIASTSPGTTYPQLVVYDATSTQATSSATVLAQFGTDSVTAGTYVFDVVFTTGLSLEVPSGFDGVYTVTYR